MATTSEIKAGLDNIAQEIRTERQALLAAKARISASTATLNSLPTRYASVIAAIDGFGNTDDFEKLTKSEKAKLATEFIALQSKSSSAATALSSIDFTT